MIAAPNDLPALNSEHEWQNLQTVAASAAIELIRIDPTYEALQAALRKAPHVFHFIGHGALPAAHEAGRPTTPQRQFSTVPNPVQDETPQEGWLAFCDQHGQSVAMPGADLATLLGNCQSLRLALLNACQGATPGATSAFAGVAQKLIQQGTPAVIAMQASIFDDHAIRFAQEFYHALADGYGVEAAVGEGRKRINEVAATWGIPTLYFQGSEPFAINDRRADSALPPIETGGAAVMGDANVGRDFAGRDKRIGGDDVGGSKYRAATINIYNAPASQSTPQPDPPTPGPAGSGVDHAPARCRQPLPRAGIL